MRFILPLVLSVALLAGGCGDDVDADTADPDASLDPDGDADPGDAAPSVGDLADEWALTALSGPDGAVVLPDGVLRMRIDDGEINGNLGCNSFFGEFTADDGGGLSFGAFGQTEMACADPSRMDFESTYGRLLGEVDAWALDGARLTLSGATVTALYERFVPVHQPLEATVWHFDSVYEGDAVTNRADMDGVELTIEDGTAVMRSPGCDSWSGDVEFDGTTEGSFALSGYGGIEPASCATVATTMESLATATHYEIDENRLTFADDDGPILGFTAR